MKRVLTTAAVLGAMVLTTLITAPQPVATATAPGPAGWSAPGSGAVVLDPEALGAPPGEAKTIATTPPAPKKPVVVRGVRVPAQGKAIEIVLATQTLIAWQDGVKVMSFKISSGRAGYRTPKGSFKVKAKGIKWWSRKWKVWMPYAMNFYSNYNLHSLPYSDPKRLIGASKLGRPDSHGCIRIGPANAKALYAWTPVGTPVVIH